MTIEFHNTFDGQKRPSFIGPLGSIPQPLDGSRNKKKKEKKYANKSQQIQREKQQQQQQLLRNISAEMKTTVQILSHGTSDCQSPSLILKTAKGDRHLFGRFGEGLQRSINQNRVKFGKLKNVFISGPLDWSSLGGLPGIILTLADQGVKKMTLHSAVDNLPWACATWRNFVLRGNLDFQIKNASKEIYSDKYICVKGVHIYPETITENDYLNRNIDQEEVDRESLSILNRLFSKQTITKQEGNDYKLGPVSNAALPAVLRDSRVSCYMIQIRPSRGKFIPQKAISLGVPRGEMFAKLADGESIITPDGKTVHPHEVLEPPNINGRVLVIDCPTNDYVKDLINGHDWRENLSPDLGSHSNNSSVNNPTNSNNNPDIPPDSKRRRAQSDLENNFIDPCHGYSEPVTVAFHMLGESVNPFDGPYFDWITQQDSTVFSPECMHFITHPFYAPDGISLESAALLNMKLRKIFPDNFKRLYTADAPLNFPSLEKTQNKLFPMLTMASISLEQDIIYQTTFEKSGGRVDWDSLEAQLDSEIEKSGTDQALRNDNKSKFKACIESDKIVEKHLKDIEIVTLGTGSAMPNKYRNVVATLVNIPSSRNTRSILFDCGENTLGNMKRIYGPEKLKEVVSNIGIFYLSHLHADHHLGAISFITYWLKLANSQDRIQRPLYIMGPWKYFDFLKEWSQLESEVEIGRLRFVDNESAIVGWGFCDKTSPNFSRYSYIQEMKQDMGLTSVRTCKAIHCELAYCVSFNFSLDNVEENNHRPSSPSRSPSRSHSPNSSKQTFQVSYSGDTRPTEFFAKRVGFGSDLLIHEATHDNGLEAEAFKKKHSTISEAIGVARSMKAKYTILTHFSQRYPKLPNMDGLQNLNEDSEATEKIKELPVFAFAFDGMHIKIGEIPKQRYFFGELEKIFDEVEEMEDEEGEDEEGNSRKK
ncbi:uncharacterized protein SAPINGB_P003842 [Magnusiomyces paraingens]|uniref:ribonuclease Z n=1 Tax=Magnusiomyces paraingens TaxID=2606893 RepID=A0A5E8BSG9_9ASCO|nr:uncharacterized protein SAPINGB_P003842 [Saprochaete ingens]VVT53971.1 unnamed protein product [Saprochaete ingens]